jgi:pre-mRNA-splicing factor ISY1
VVLCVVALVWVGVAPSAPKQTRFELYKSVDADYYGYRDDDDGLLKPLEAKEEAIGTQRTAHRPPIRAGRRSPVECLLCAARAKAVEKHKKQQAALKVARLKALGLQKSADGSTLDDAALAKMVDEETNAEAAAAASEAAELKAHVVLPTEQDVEKLVLEKKRKGE